MSQRKIVLLTALVLFLFGFIFLFERKMPTTSEAKEKSELVWEIPEEQIDDLRLERPDSTVELKKTGPSAWRLVRPEAYPADPATAEDVVSQLAKLRRSGGESAEARPEDYGLAPPEKAATPGSRPVSAPANTRATISWKDPASAARRLSRTLEFGVDIPGTDATAARVAGSATVIFVPSSVATSARKKVDDFKSKEVFGSSSADVVRLDVERGRGRVSLNRRDGVWWLSQPLSDLADGDAAQRLVDELTGLRTLEFLPAGQNLAELGLAPPLYRVTLAQPAAAPPGAKQTPAAPSASGATTPNAAPTAGPATSANTVELGATRSDGNSVYARKESQVFTVSSTIVEDLSREAVAFREPRVARFDRAAVASLGATFGADKFELTRKDAGWASEGRTVTAAAADDLMTAILDMKSRAFSDEATAAALRARPSAATITVRLTGNQNWVVSLYPGRDDAQALVSGRPGAFALSTDPVPGLEAAFRKASGRKS